MGIVRAGTWANRPLGFAGKVFASNPVSNARNWENGSYIAVPAGYLKAAMILPIKYGAIGTVARGTSTLAGTMKADARMAALLAGIAVLTGKITLLVESPCTMSGTGGLTARIKSTGRLGCQITIGSQPSAVDNASATLNFELENGLTVKHALRLLMSFMAGNATGLDTAPVFKSLDGTKDRITGIVSGGTRTITSVDPT